MKRVLSKTTDVLEKIVLLLPLLIALGFVYLTQPVSANQVEAFLSAPDGDQAESATQPIVPALLPAGRRLFQSPLPTPTFTPTPESPTPTNTPEPPTPTNTPEPPMPTNTPISNRPPQIIDITIPLSPVHVDQQPIIVEAQFTDPDTTDTHTARWDWGDGTSSVCPAECVLDQVDDRVGGSHTYTEPDIYQVSLTVTDAGNLSDMKVAGFIVIYDPSGGFVTGGGWIDSEAGAYKPDPTLSDKANFAFHSKYKRGATVPTGNTVFNFKAGDLNFHSDSYQWLVINRDDSNAQFKGLGTINGALSPTNQPYSFMVWAMDNDPDTFRLKIWYETPSGDAIVYDNGFSQPIGGGSIVVHQGK